MIVNIAGNTKEVNEGVTVAELIVSEKVENPDYVTVVVNDDFVDKSEFDTHVLNDNDKVEFLYFMGGGK